MSHSLVSAKAKYRFFFGIKTVHLQNTCTQINPNLDPFFIVDSPDHLHTHLSDLVEVWQLQANIPQDLYDSFSYTDTCVL